jgi:uncharacterized membrane protein
MPRRLDSVGTDAGWYSYNSTDGTPVRLFAVRDSGGGVRVALDACGVCYGAKKGYAQSGNSMVCRNCGMRFPVAEIGSMNAGAGCWPSDVQYSVRDGFVEIPLAALDEKAWMFG